MSGEVERAAAVLAEHVRLSWADKPYTCACEPGTQDGTGPHHRHQAEALAAAGLLAEPAAEVGLRAAGEVTDEQIDADLCMEGFDPDESYPEYGHDALRQAYRAGRAALAGHAPQAGEGADPHARCRELIYDAYMKGRIAGPPDPNKPAVPDDLDELARRAAEVRGGLGGGA